MIKFLSFFFALLTTPLYAAERAADVQTLQNSPLSAMNLLQTILGLLLVLGCVVLVAWLLKSSHRFHSTVNGKLKIIASLTLGPRERLIVVQLGNEQLLLGITPQRINTLYQLTEPLQPEQSEKGTSAFANQLKQLLQQKEGKQ